MLTRRLNEIHAMDLEKLVRTQVVAFEKFMEDDFARLVVHTRKLAEAVKQLEEKLQSSTGQTNTPSAPQLDECLVVARQVLEKHVADGYGDEPLDLQTFCKRITRDQKHLVPVLDGKVGSKKASKVMAESLAEQGWLEAVNASPSSPYRVPEGRIDQLTSNSDTNEHGEQDQESKKVIDFDARFAELDEQ